MKSLVFVCVILSGLQVRAELKEWAGQAYNKKGQLVYLEKQQAWYKEGQIVKLKSSYTSVSGRSIGYIQSDFSKKAFTPVYDSKDFRFNTTEGLFWKGEQLFMFHNKQKKPRKEKVFPWSPKLVSGQGLHKFIMAHFRKLIATKKAIDIDFLLPAKFDSYKFRVKAVQGKNKFKVTFKVEFRSWLMRFVAPHLEVDYDLKSKRLLEFRGPSNVLTDAGESQYVVIKYQYP